MTGGLPFADRESDKIGGLKGKSFSCFVNCVLVYTGLAFIITGIIGTLYGYSFSTCYFNKCQYQQGKVIFMRVTGPLFLDLGLALLVFAIYRLYRRRNTDYESPPIRAKREETEELIIEQGSSHANNEYALGLETCPQGFAPSLAEPTNSSRADLLAVPPRSQPIGSFGYNMARETSGVALQFPTHQVPADSASSTLFVNTSSHTKRSTPYHNKHSHYRNELHPKRYKRKSPKRLRSKDREGKANSKRQVTTIYEAAEQASN